MPAVLPYPDTHLPVHPMHFTGHPRRTTRWTLGHPEGLGRRVRQDLDEVGSERQRLDDLQHRQNRPAAPEARNDSSQVGS